MPQITLKKQTRISLTTSAIQQTYGTVQATFHDDGTFDLSNTLGLLNSQRIAFNGSVNPLEALKIDLGVTAEMALSELKAGDEEYDVYNGQVQSWWTARRFDEEDTPLFNRTGGAEFTFKPAVAYTLEDYGITIGAYGDMNYQAYQWSDGIDEDF